jgi:hypothetical protein
MIRQPRYRSGDASSILGVSRDHLRYLEDRIEGSGTTGWRNRSLLDLFRVLLAIELSQHGVDAAHAVRLAHEIRLGYEDSHWAGKTFLETSTPASLEEQLTGELFGQTLIAYRDGDNWQSRSHWADDEHPVDWYIAGSAVVIRLRPLGERLMRRLRQHALGEQA